MPFFLTTLVITEGQKLNVSSSFFPYNLHSAGDFT